MKRAVLILATLVFAAGAAWARVPGSGDEVLLAADVERELQSALDVDAGDDIDALYRACMRAHGELAPLSERIDAILLEEPGEDRRRAALRVDGYLSWRYGRLADALERFEQLSEDSSDVSDRFARARLLDATGEAELALEAYGELVEVLDDPDLTTRLLVRMALMSMESGGEEGEDALSAFAGEDGRAVELVNRAAIVLALLGRPADAIELYVVEGDAKTRARGELRVAEWALRAEDPERAQRAAWNAVEAATVARERRYALTILTEAHRADDSLEALVERFAADPDSLPVEARRVWIELLREIGAWDDAIALVSGDGDSFTDDERRSLLEMYRESGREDDMVAAYRERIADEPASTVWREGLAQTFLERGEREAAVEVWSDWLDRHGRDARLLGAQVLRDIGLVDLAEVSAESAIAEGEDVFGGLLFLFELHRDAGDLDLARATLDRLDAVAGPEEPVRLQLAEAHERLGDKGRAVEILGDLVAARPPGEAGEDVEMRYAWLLSEVGDEEAALSAWRELWLRVNSVPRRRYVEDRMMTVASRLGSLADIAVDLEEKLIEGTATERDSGLLVRLYTKVGDAVSAAEVIEEFMRRSGGDELQTLTEKSRVYLSCNDYYHYERAVRRLIEIDPEGEADYLQQLAMSQLERGRPDEARVVLARLATLDSEASSVEFEAGVLALSGMRAEAVAAYRRGLAAHPERIDGYLLMAGLMKQLGQDGLAFGMFQHLAETADGDDLFTIAIDGILNMLVDAPPRPKVLEWARRATLERLATRHDKPYLYQLLADLAEERGDQEGRLAALENSLASSGPRRGSVLRELMDLCAEQPATFGVEGRPAQPERHLAYGRRLVGLAEAVPPQVYLDLGAAFLEAGDEDSAARTFNLTRELPDGVLYQRQAAGRFERAGFIERALDTYTSVLATQPTDVSLLVKVGELREQLGSDAEASALYLRAMDLLLRRRPLATGAEPEDDEPEAAYRWVPRNLDDFGRHYERVLAGVLATVEDGAAFEALLRDQAETLRAEVLEALALRAAMDAGSEEDGEAAALRLTQFPRLESRAGYHRRAAFADARTDLADELDRELLATFNRDDELLETMVRERLTWGLNRSARELIAASGRTAEEQRELLVKVGEVVETDAVGPIPLAEAARRILPLVMEDRLDEVGALVRRADLRQVEPEAMGQVAVLFSAARLLDDEGLILRVAREWVRLELGSSPSPYMLEGRIDQLGGALEGDAERSFYRYFVSLVLDDVEQNASLVTMLPQLARRFEEPIVDEEEVLSLLDGYGERYAWGLGPVLELLPPAERAGALRSLWDRVEKTNRASLLIDLVMEFQSDLGPELESFVVESFAASLEDADEFIKYSIGQMLEVDRNREALLGLANAFVEKFPANASARAVVALQEHALGRPGAEERAAEVWVELQSDDSNDYYVHNARNRLREEFLPEAIDAFTAALDGWIDEQGESADLLQTRRSLLLAAEREDEAEALLEAGLETYPEDVALLSARAGSLSASGRAAEAAAVEARIAELTEDEDGRKSRLSMLAGRWASLEHPERELLARQELEELGGIDESNPAAGLPPGAIMIINGVIYRGGESDEGLPKTIGDVKEALDRDDVSEARVILRRLWRSFIVGEDEDTRFSFFTSSPMASLSWPHDPKEDEEEAEPSRGGLVAFLEHEAKAAEREREKEAGEAEAEDELPTAYQVMAESDVLVDEMERFLRTRRPAELDRLQPLYEGLLEARRRAVGEDAVLADLLATMRSGVASKGEMIQLLAALDARPEAAAEAGDVVSALVNTLSPRDVAQIRRLARVLVRAERTDEALRLYRWCATQADGTGRSMVVFGAEETGSTVTVRELVAEAREQLEGDDRIELIEAALGYAHPGDYPWMRENFEELVLTTWQQTVDPAEALERTRAVCDGARDLSTGLRRRVALRAASIYAAAGEVAPALEALEVGIAKLDPALVTQPEETWYRSDPERVGYFSTADLRQLFPAEVEERADPLPWLRAAAGAFEAWLDAERVDEDQSLRALLLIAVRLDDLDRRDEAAELVERIAGRAEDPPVWLELWLADLHRRFDRDDLAAAVERRLLAERRLHVQRVPDVIAGVLAAEGPEAALTAAAPIAEDTRHPDLMATLVEAAEALGDSASIERWREAQRAAEAARAELEALAESE